MGELALDHLSGRWDRAPRLLNVDVTESAAHADIITLTEVAADRRAAVLPREGWAVLQDRRGGDMGECAIMFRREVYRVIAWTVAELGPDMGPGGRVVGVFAVLQNRHTRERIVVGTAHLPSAVEGDWRTRGRRVLTHQAAVQESRRRMRRMFRRYRCDAAVFVADWNLNLRRRWVRTWVRAAWPVMRVPKRIPATGTHGRRLIDWAVARRIPDLTMRVLPVTDASDHRRLRLGGTITRRNR